MLNIKIGKLPIAYFAILPICLLMMNTSSIILRYNKLLYYIICAIYVMGINLNAKRYKEDKMWILSIMLLWITSFWSLEYTETRAFCTSITMYSLLLLQNRDVGFYESFAKWFNRIVILGMITIYVNAFIPNLFSEKLSFLMAEGVEKTVASAVKGKKYSGIFYDVANAAFALNIGFAMAYSKYMDSDKRGKKTSLMLMAAFVGAVVLTGKRTLCAIPVALIVISGLLKSNDSKQKRIYGLITVVIIGILVFAPNLSQYFVRSDGGDDIFNSRTTVLWPIATEAFKTRVFTGTGLNTFNTLIQRAYMYTGSKVLSNWTFHAHNIYIQLLSETGIIIATVIFVTFACILRATRLALKEEDNPKIVKMLRLSYFIQIIWLLYGLTGNTFYYKGQLLAYIVAIGMLGACRYEQEKNRHINISQGD